MKCPKCNFDNPESTNFCGKCGEPLLPSKKADLPHTKTLQTSLKELARGETFANRYEVIEELGKGGMGMIYRVFDKSIKEEVALKLINPEIARDERTIERFSNELKFARKIAHRNVCRMFDLDEEKGTHYITMEFVLGESLKSMIGMMGQLSAAQVVFLAKQVCEGLAEAHRLGVVHRDLKPSNIIIDKEGTARIMDFGIARSLKEKGITGAGVMMGTPEYMSPEQVEAKEVDKRSDIYSLGVILYEMVTGRLPFEGETALSIALKHRTETPLEPKQFNTQIPEDLNLMILKCIEKDKEKRYQDTRELLAELNKIEEGATTAERIIPKRKPATSKETREALRKRWIIAAVVFIAFVAVGVAVLYFAKRIVVLPQGEKMLVVLPFKNLGPPGDEYFADGITEEITSRLAALQGLGVISRTSAVQYKNTDKTLRQIGDELGVDYALEGSVRWDRSAEGKGRVRVTPQLVRVSDDSHLWSERYDRVIEDIFLVQSEIAEQVAQQLDLTVLEPERRALNAQPTDSLEAYDYYLRGLEHEARGWAYSDDQEFEQAIEMFEKATELDPDFALAYARISSNHSRMYHFGIGRTEERLARSRAAVDRALELQPDLPEARQALAIYYYRGFLDYDRAAEIFESLQKARPNTSPSILGYIQRRMGKWEESVAMLERAFRLNPRDSQTAYETGLSYLSMRKYIEAEQWFNRVLSLNPDHLTARLGKVAIYVLSEGNTREAKALLETLPRHPLTDYMWYTLGMLERNYQEVQDRLASLSYDHFEGQQFYFLKNLTYASLYYAMKELSLMKSRAEPAVMVLEEAVKDSPQDPRFHASLGLAYAYLGRKSEAIQEGNRAVELNPVSKDAALGPPYVLNLTRIYVVVDEYDKAINQLEYLLSIPSSEFLWQVVSIPLLRLDPIWDPLRENPRFQSLLQKQ